MEAKKDATQILAELMLEEKAEKVKAAQDAKALLEKKNKQRIKTDAEKFANELRRQGNCDHLQGNHKIGEAPFREIGALSMHTFQDASSRIRCNKCGFKWYPKDTVEFLPPNKVRGNTAPIANPTGMSWTDAYKMCMKFKNLGNKPSTGFITMNVSPVVQAVEEV